MAIDFKSMLEKIKAKEEKMARGEFNAADIKIVTYKGSDTTFPMWQKKTGKENGRFFMMYPVGLKINFSLITGELLEDSSEHILDDTLEKQIALVCGRAVEVPKIMEHLVIRGRVKKSITKNKTEYIENLVKKIASMELGDILDKDKDGDEIHLLFNDFLAISARFTKKLVSDHPDINEIKYGTTFAYMGKSQEETDLISLLTQINNIFTEGPRAILDNLVREYATTEKSVSLTESEVMKLPEEKEIIDFKKEKFKELTKGINLFSRQDVRISFPFIYKLREGEYNVHALKDYTDMLYTVNLTKGLSEVFEADIEAYANSNNKFLKCYSFYPLMYTHHLNKDGTFNKSKSLYNTAANEQILSDFEESSGKKLENVLLPYYEERDFDEKINTRLYLKSVLKEKEKFVTAVLNVLKTLPELQEKVLSLPNIHLLFDEETLFELNEEVRKSTKKELSDLEIKLNKNKKKSTKKEVVEESLEEDLEEDLEDFYDYE